jgi:hypothetical protein
MRWFGNKFRWSGKPSSSAFPLSCATWRHRRESAATHEVPAFPRRLCPVHAANPRCRLRGARTDLPGGGGVSVGAFDGSASLLSGANPGVCMACTEFKTMSLLYALQYANWYVISQFRYTIGIQMQLHPGAAVTAARVWVGLLPLGGAHVVCDDTPRSAGLRGRRSAKHRLCVGRRQ